MIKRQKFINRKTGQIREVSLTVGQAAGHGYEPYEEPKVAQVVKPDPIKETKPQEPDNIGSGVYNPHAKEPEPKEPENAALAPATTPKPATKKPGRKPKTPKSE